MSPGTWLRSWLQSEPRIPTRRPKARLATERLEDRATPTVTVSVADATLSEIGGTTPLVAAGSGGLDTPAGLLIGPNGDLYVASSDTDSILRYNATTGQFLGTFVAPRSGGLDNPVSFTFGPDGHLYVGSLGTDAVLRYNGATGAFMNTFVPAGSGGLDSPRGLLFGPDGSLYLLSWGTDSILRYQGPGGSNPGSPHPAPGQSGATFAPPGSGGLNDQIHMILGPDNRLYVANGNSVNAVIRFDVSTGDFIDVFAQDGEGGLAGPRGLVFDQDGRLLVSDSGDAVHRFDATGQYLDDLLIRSVSTQLSKPIGMVFDAQGALLITCRVNDTVVRYDGGVTVTLSEASPTPVTVAYATADGTALATTDYYTQTGTVTFGPGETSRRVLLATRDDLDVEASESFSVQLSNPTGGAVIVDGSAAVTTTDEDAARQVSAADATTIEGDNAPHYRGAFVDGIPGMHFGILTFGPDGNLYTQVGTGPGFNTIRRYDGNTGAFLDTFVPHERINGVRDIVFRAGYVYVGSEGTDEVLRFNAATGAFVDTFVTAGSGGIDGPHGLTFGPDANGDSVSELYVSGRNSFNVVRYDGATGLPLGTYVTPGLGGLSWPEAMTFDAAGQYLFVASTGSSQILKYNAHTGAYAGVGASTGLSAPKDVKFGPDGLMYVTSGGNDRIPRFTAAGVYVDDYVPAGAGGLDNPSRLAFDTDGDLYVTGVGNSEILRFGTANEVLLTVTLSVASSLPVTVNYATADCTAAAGDYTATAGTVTFAPGVTKVLVRVPIQNDAAVEGTETFAVNLSGPVGMAIADGQAAATITDDEVTKFFVVDDATANRTYRYGAPGNTLTDSALDGGNTAPRGAASTAAGDKVWVADVNKKVYVYSAAGALLGSWTAGGLTTAATPEGIATNGTDVWIVDSKQDKVFRYTGAASRTSGSQNAASSFALNSGNKNPKDLVTDGASLWVVDDGTTDKVFKYTLAGTLLGSWTITGGGGSPTGITLDPSAPAHLWVVDNATDRVYQFDNAAGRTSGSQAASQSFALAAGNANPQGIADPPTTVSVVTLASPGTHPVNGTVALGRPRRPDASPIGGLARVGADWFTADDHDRSPVLVDHPVSRPRRA